MVIKIFALLIAMVMVLGMSTAVFAQEKAYTGTDGDGAVITISNAANGETYKIAKLFDATVSVAQTDGVSNSIAYTGDIPEALASYFTKDSAGNISATDALVLTNTTVQNALKTWAEANVTDQAVSDGSELKFTGLPYGYYIITTTQGNTLLTVDSTRPNATVIDKNTTPPVSNLGKKVAGTDEVVSIGDTITYTVTFNTANYDGEAQIDKYVITDTLPEFLSDVTVTSIRVIEVAAQDAVEDDPETTDVDESQAAVAEQATSLTVTQFDDDGKITITWAQGGTNLYKNGSTIEIVYTAKVNDKVAAGNVETNKNEVTVQAFSGDKVTTNGEGKTEETIKTYAAAVQKVDENNKKLAGATFQVPGLTVTGSAGNYTVVSYNPGTEEEPATAGTTMVMDDNGFLVIRGISNEETITIYEVDAPDGYNKLTEGKTLPVVATSTTTTTTATTTETTTYYDSEGNVVDEAVEGGSSTTITTTTLATNDDLVSGQLTVINQKGSTLPSTGGIGTTIFYIIGAILVIGAGVVLVTRRRMNAN